MNLTQHLRSKPFRLLIRFVTTYSDEVCLDLWHPLPVVEYPHQFTYLETVHLKTIARPPLCTSVRLNLFQGTYKCQASYTDSENDDAQNTVTLTHLGNLTY